MCNVFAETVHVRLRQIELPDGSEIRRLRELLGPWWESHAAGRTHSPSRSRDGTGRRRFCEYLCVTNGFFTHFTPEPSITVVHLLLVRQQLLDGYCSFSKKKKKKRKEKHSTLSRTSVLSAAHQLLELGYFFWFVLTTNDGLFTAGSSDVSPPPNSPHEFYTLNVINSSFSIC